MLLSALPLAGGAGVGVSSHDAPGQAHPKPLPLAGGAFA